MNCTKPLAAFLVLFAQSVWSADPTAKVEIPADVSAVASASNEFATDLYAHLASDKSTNLFFSPYSISTVLAMMYGGSNGQTKSQMANVLHIPKQESEPNPAFASLTAFLAPTRKSEVQLRIASRLWAQKGIHILPAFLEATKANFGADVGLVNLKAVESAQTVINAWVEKQTDRKIKDLITPGIIDSNSNLILTNAIYFKANWEYPFQRKSTADAPFHTSDSQQIPVPMMHQTRHFRYGETENVQTLELPYSGGDGLSMLILLPRRIEDFERLLTNENLQKWTDGMKSRETNVHLPRFRLASQVCLGNVLKEMGMPLAFSNEADFSGISRQERLHVSTVVHKAFVEVNEEGTEAAAATGLVGSLGKQKTAEFRADRPFVFLIRHQDTQCILFVGRVMNPKIP